MEITQPLKMALRFRDKKAAIELSIGTIVIIVLAMSMLILGIILVRNIFTGATGATELINDNVKAQINKLFNEEDAKLVVYLPESTANVKKGGKYNIRFAIKETTRGTSEPGIFSYDTVVNEIDPGCSGLSQTAALNYISLGTHASNIRILSGDKPKEQIIVMQIPDTAPLCNVRYDINVKRNGEFYDSTFFILSITG